MLYAGPLPVLGLSDPLMQVRFLKSESCDSSPAAVLTVRVQLGWFDEGREESFGLGGNGWVVSSSGGAWDDYA
jgi:hypothetical protein